jgi:hypothetical protein
MKEYYFLNGETGAIDYLGEFKDFDEADRAADGKSCVWLFDAPPVVNKKPAYNHAFTLAFSAGDMRHSDPEKCLLEQESDIKKALVERVEYLINNPSELAEALDCFDTYEEQ